MEDTLKKHEELIKITIILLIVIFVGIFGKKILDSILQALNLQDTEDEKKNKKSAEVQENLAVDFFSTNYYKTVPQNYVISAGTISMKNAHATGKKIYNSIGYIYDSPEETAGAFALAKTKADVSKIADTFNSDYQKDLLTWLSGKLDTDAQKQAWTKLLKRLNSLPDGFTKK